MNEQVEPKKRGPKKQLESSVSIDQKGGVVPNLTNATAAEDVRSYIIPMTLSKLTGIKVKRAMLHQAFQVPNAGTETTIHCERAGMKDISIIYTTSGLVIENKGHRVIVPLANVIACYE